MKQLELFIDKFFEYLPVTTVLFVLVALMLWRIVLLAHPWLVKKLSRSGALSYVEVVVERTARITLLLLSTLLLAWFWDIPGGEPAALWLHRAAVVILAVQGGVWGTAVIQLLLAKHFAQHGDMGRGAAYSLLAFLGQVVVWSLLLILALENLGVDVTALIAGLGLGGVALALAVQNILGDLFASLAITLDRPFEVGDFIIADQMKGTVERIGIKTTRVRSLSGEQIVLANSDLLGSRIQNYKRMNERRVVFSLRVEHDTPLELLQEIPPLLAEIVRNKELTRFDRAHLQEISEWAYTFEIVYFVNSPEYNRYMDIQQQILFEVVESFERLGVKFAVPARNVIVRDSERPAQGA